MYKITVTVAFADTFTEPRPYWSGTAQVFSRSIAKGIELATKAAEDKSKGAWYTPILNCISVVDAHTGKIIMERF